MQILIQQPDELQCHAEAWMEVGGEWIQVYEWLSPFTVHLNCHNIVNWLYPSMYNKKLKKKKKKAGELKNQEKLMFQSEFKIQPCPSSAVDRRIPYDSFFLFYSSLQLVG